MVNLRFPFRKHKSSDNPRPGSGAQSTVTVDSGQVSEGGQSYQEGNIASTSRPTTLGDSDSLYEPRRSSKASIRDPLGLSVVHRPQGVHKVDIVFVHGLGGTSHLTWSKDKDPELFWPHRFLAQEPDIAHARILTFGYDASFRPGSSKNATTVLDFAKDLLFEMKYAKDELHHELGELNMGQCPILFVVHSMGGLLVKEAYMQGLHDPDYEKIVESISAIIFLSTPHRGTNLAEILNRILQVSVVSAPKQFISELMKNSYTLQKLNEQFRHVASKLDIVSFYETRTTHVGFGKARVMVLEKDSSVLGYPGEISKPLDADHHGICKYESRQDPLYITVRNVIQSLLNKLPPSADIVSPVISSTQTWGKKVEEFLSVHELPDNDFAFFRDRWTPGTCNWILEHGAFETWLENSNYKPCLLWIYGNAASGKSVLSSFIIDHLNRHGKICQYFFVRFGDQRKRSVQAVLRSLSAQIARAVPEYGKKLMKLASDAIDLKTADVRSLWKWLFSNGVCAMELQKPLYWVLDGVDELDDPETMIKLLSDLSSYKVPIRLLLVSRKTQELSSAIQKLGKGLDMISIRREGSLDDFKRFIDEEMDDVAGNESHKSRVTSLILERASGNFLWVHFAVQRINKCISQKDVEEALEQLPTGMGALYDRMASTIADNPNDTARHLAKDILAWTTCARRLMTIAELSGALGEDAPLDMQRSIGNLCGGFVVVDIDGKVALIHQTARQYLFSQSNQFFAIRKQSAHALLFNRCMSCLMEPNLRAKINRNQEPDFLDYAISSWFVHFCLADETSSSILPTVTAFLKGPYVLTWIHSVAKSGNMQPLVLASQYLTTFLTKRRGWHHHLTSHDHFTAAQETIERWAIDILKLVGKFGRSIVSHPQAIYRLIAPFCPHESIMYQQFGRKESSILSVTGFSNKTWDDCLGRISLEQGTFTSSVLAAGSRIGILSLAGRSSTISIYHASTFEDLCQITHAERVLKMHLNNSGDILVTYGYSTTKAWDLITGRCIKSVTNPENRPWPHTILFTDRDNTLLAGCDDRRLRSLTLGVASSQWEVVADFDEKQHEGTIVNSPTCMALSPEGDLMALGYRGHPLTLWEVCEPKLTAQCTRTLGGAFETTASEAWGEVIQLAWHPFSGQVLGLYLEGTLFKWQPFENEVQEIMAGANKLAVNRDGALCATGDANGTIKVFHTANFSLCYRLCSEDPVLDLSFSFDSRRVYDVRGTYANMWEPNILVRIVGNPDLLERSSDDASSSESLIKPYTSSECWFGKIDTVSAICAQKAGPLYCYGTEEGVVNLCERGRGKVGELQRSKSFMSIEHITWSDDGKFVAFGDTSGKLVVKSIDVNSDGIDPWSISTVMDTFVSVPGGEIVQLLFHPRGDKFLVCTATGLRTIGIGGTVISEISGAGMSPVLKWMCHPSSTEHLIGFGKESLHIYNWNTLGETNCITYQVSESDATTSAAYRADRWGSRKATVRVTLTTDSTRFLVQIFSPLPDSRKEVHYFFISVEALNTQAGMLSVKNNISENDLSMVIPLECESELRMPLCFLPRGRLVFLDINYAFCTGRLPMDANVGRRRSSTKTTTITTKLEDVKRHFVLPADWISSESAALCCTFTDGTLLYPKNGEVAVIQFDSLRQGSI